MELHLTRFLLSRLKTTNPRVSHLLFMLVNFISGLGLSGWMASIFGSGDTGLILDAR